MALSKRAETENPAKVTWRQDPGTKQRSRSGYDLPVPTYGEVLGNLRRVAPKSSGPRGKRTPEH